MPANLQFYTTSGGYIRGEYYDFSDENSAVFIAAAIINSAIIQCNGRS
jgi:hypothetical protein